MQPDCSLRLKLPILEALDSLKTPAVLNRNKHWLKKLKKKKSSPSKDIYLGYLLQVAKKSLGIRSSRKTTPKEIINRIIFYCVIG